MSIMDIEYAVEMKDVSFRYKSRNDYIFNKINLRIRKGEAVGVVGLSGSGKSTLMNIINGVIPKRIPGFMEGTVLIFGKDTGKMELPQIACMVGTVFQDPDTQIVFSTVEDEIAFGPENLCANSDVILKRIDSVTSLLGINHLRLCNPNKLSGGEKQLVVLASVLSLEPDILILDECMSQVDAKGKVLIKNIISTLKAEGKTIIMVEHDEKNIDIVGRVLRLQGSGIESIQKA